MVNMSRFTHSYDLGEAVALYHSLRMKPVYLSKDAFRSLQAWLASSFCDKIENAPGEILVEVQELAKFKILTQTEDEDEKVLAFVKSKIPAPAVNVCYMIMSEQCNLACKYCFLGNNDCEKRSNFLLENMSTETADKAIDFFIRQIKASGMEYTNNKPVLIFYGGEPMVNFRVLEHTAARVNELRKEEPCIRNIEMSMVTNGLLLDEAKVKRLHELGVAIATIGTYFGINRSIILIYAAVLGLDEESFVLNKEENLCEECHGLGYIKVLDQNRIVDYDIPLAKNPFRCWNRYKDFYQQIIQQFCTDNSIDANKNFRQLTNREKRLILYGESEKKYSVRYKKSAGFSRRTTRYYGVMTGKPMQVNYATAGQFYKDEICKCCQGKKYSLQHEKWMINGLSIGDFMSMPFEKLLPHIEQMIAENTDTNLQFAIKSIHKFVCKAIELNLGYLFFHRSIPTLSGGELQRLRMVQVLSTQLSNLLLVLDEPLAGLSGKEKATVFQEIIDLAKTHTIIIVDHSDAFVSRSKQIIALGEKGGANGGFLIDVEKYLAEQRVRNKIETVSPQKIHHVIIDNSVYSYSGVNLTIGENRMNLITGRSGVGKSTLLREYLPQYYEDYLYINQTSIPNTLAVDFVAFKSLTRIFSPPDNVDIGCPIFKYPNRREAASPKEFIIFISASLK